MTEDGSSGQPRPLHIAIIGAGMSGILCAIRLLESGYDNFSIYEKGPSVGGTWRENRYPGLSCDIPSHVYAYSFAPNPEWTRKYSAGPEIRAYFERIAERYDIVRRIRFDCEITRAALEDDSWRLWSGDEELRRAHVVLSATGILHHPNVPHFDGLETFRGRAFHTARWPNDVTLDGQRVGIIGTGSTAIQIVSDVVDRVRTLRLFQRTAQWVWPDANKFYSEDDKARFRENPAIMAHMKRRMSEQIDQHFSDALVDADGPAMQRLEAECLRNLAENVHDPTLRSKLTPDYRAGCKRLIMSDTFYPAIQKPNADVVTAQIERIEADGIRTADGELHPLDVLVLATGFNAHQFMRPMQVIGEGGLSLDDYWADSVRAYRSISMPGFPNFFMLMGPQSPVGNFSLIDVAEVQFDYIAELLALLRDGRCRRVAPTVEATERFTRDVVAAMKNTIWVSGCSSWYLDARGVPITWPWTVGDFHDAMRAVELEDYAMSA